MPLTEDVRRAFAGFAFGPPCHPDDVAAAERALGHPLPPILRELYAAFDGFEGSTATAFFYPPIAPRAFSGTTLVEVTLSLREVDIFPAFLDRAVTFGNYGCGPSWGIRLDAPDEVFEWEGELGDGFEVMGTDLLAVWLEQKQVFDGPSSSRPETLPPQLSTGNLPTIEADPP